MEVSQNSLRDIHTLHKRIAALRSHIDQGPRQLNARRELVEQQATGLEQAREALTQLKLRTKQKEIRSSGLEDRIKNLQIKINSAKSNKEYSTLISERDADKAAQGALEDEILELFEKNDELVREIEKGEQELARQSEELERFERTIAQKEREDAAGLADCETRLREAEASLPGDMLDIYRRLVRARGCDALAEVQGTICRGCHTAITPQMRNELLGSAVVLCKSCGRILYLQD